MRIPDAYGALLGNLMGFLMEIMNPLRMIYAFVFILHKTNWGYYFYAYEQSI